MRREPERIEATACSVQGPGQRERHHIDVVHSVACLGVRRFAASAEPRDARRRRLSRGSIPATSSPGRNDPSASRRGRGLDRRGVGLLGGLIHLATGWLGRSAPRGAFCAMARLLSRRWQSHVGPRHLVRCAWPQATEPRAAPRGVHTAQRIHFGIRGRSLRSGAVSASEDGTAAACSGTEPRLGAIARP